MGAHGSMTWQKIFEIPPKPGLQFFRVPNFNIFTALRTPSYSPAHAPSPTKSLALSELISLHSFIFPPLKTLRSRITMPKTKADARGADNRLKRKGAGAGRKQTKKAAKDPNKPKRPPSAFFVFMAEFREQFKKEHPNNKSVAVVGKAGGEKWKSLSDAEKAPYVAKAEKKKEEYDKTIQNYNKRLAEGKNPSEEEESDKSRSEVNDDDEEEDEDDDE